MVAWFMWTSRTERDGLLGVVSAAVDEVEAGAVDGDADGVEVAVVSGTGRDVGEGIEVGGVVNNFGDRAFEVVCVVDGGSAGLFGDGFVFEIADTEASNAARVEGIDGDLLAGEGVVGVYEAMDEEHVGRIERPGIPSLPTVAGDHGGKVEAQMRFLRPWIAAT
jgi:hypothetical protein